MLIQNQVGPVAGSQSISPGVLSPMRAGNLGDAIVSELHGRYYETTYRRALFTGSVVGQVTTVGFATIYTGLCLTNPIGSTVNLVLNKVGIAFLVAFAAGSSYGVMTGYNAATAVTQTTPITPKNQFVGVGGSGTGLLASAATLPTAPVNVNFIGAGLTGAITTVPYIGPSLVDYEGSIILPPGAYAAVYTSTVSGAASLSASFSWEEVPV